MLAYAHGRLMFARNLGSGAPVPAEARSRSTDKHILGIRRASSVPQHQFIRRTKDPAWTTIPGVLGRAAMTAGSSSASSSTGASSKARHLASGEYLAPVWALASPGSR